MHFATRLRQERLRRHLSQETLAEALGVSARTISRWEQGKGIPQPILRIQLSRYFELSPEALFEAPETLSSLMQEDAEEPDEAPSLAVPALPEHHAQDAAASVEVLQEAKVSGRSPARRRFSRRPILLGLGVLGLMVLSVGAFPVVLHPLAALYALDLKGTPPHMTASVPIGMTATAHTAGASDTNGGTYICWGANAHLPAPCMNLQNNTFRVNQPIALWSSQSGSGLGWNISIRGTVTSTWPFAFPSLTTRYRGDVVAYFEKTTGTGHNGCLGVTSTMHLAWEPCGHADTSWVISKYGYLVNISHSNSTGAPLAASVCDASNGGTIRLESVNKPNQCLGGWTFL